MTPEQAKALIELSGGLLEPVRESLRSQGALKTRAYLQEKTSPENARALLDAADCQLRFAHKFHQVERWLLSREAAEQATRSDIACWRAQYFRERFSGLTQLTELGTGIGGDSVYLARHFELEGYEQIAARAILCAANIRALSPGALPHRLQTRSAVPCELSGQLLFVDPARRDGARKFDPEEWRPPLSQLLALDSFSAVAVKAAPGLSQLAVPAGFETHFLSHRGELKEAMLLRTPESSSARHAWLWSREHDEPLHLWGSAQSCPTRAPRVDEYLLNPDPALLRSGLLASFAAPLGAGVVHPKIGYLSSPAASPTAWADSFRALEIFTLNWKRLSEALPRLGWRDFEYLGRGVPFSQDEVLAKLKKARKAMNGDRRGSLIIYRACDDYQAILAERAA